ncbi:MAG: DUF1566 domain-containing protein [Deltaproteobacteria bacterium]|nr:DUF1566 domain-containing protein [Deltaproteobacteria bacterium]
MKRLHLAILGLPLLAPSCGFDTTGNGTDVTAAGANDGAPGGTTNLAYAIVDTAQATCFGTGGAMSCPAAGDAFFGQDAQYLGTQPSYTQSADGLTILDNVTGLTWQRSPDTNGDGSISYADKLTYTSASAYCQGINAVGHGGFKDWRLPSIKELYSLIDFRGIDPSNVQGTDTAGLTPFIDRTYFGFAYGQTSHGERIIDAQYASSTTYVAATQQMFGVNFADGRIKGYPAAESIGKRYYVQCVRGNTAYGVNDFVDNGDQTITDKATGLMWTKGDSDRALDWQRALDWVQAKNAEKHLGYSDWRLPNVKELQSILDYSRSPDTTQSAAIDALFNATSIINEGSQPDFPWYWASTSHGLGATYVAFGRAQGWMKIPPSAACYTLYDIHGAGAQRSDPKVAGNYQALGSACSGGTAYGHGPQGDVQRGSNFVRVVRGGAATFQAGPGSLPAAGSTPDAGALAPSDGGSRLDAAPDGGMPPRQDGSGPKSCVTQTECEAEGACPSSLGCTCAQMPNGKACIPKCNTTDDCPPPPSGVTLICGPEKLCVPG